MAGDRWRAKKRPFADYRQCSIIDSWRTGALAHSAQQPPRSAPDLGGRLQCGGTLRSKLSAPHPAGTLRFAIACWTNCKVKGKVAEPSGLGNFT